MICYRDMTFCQFYEDCAKASDCSRPLTDRIRDNAKAWWGGPGAPIAQFADKPKCHELTA